MYSKCENSIVKTLSLVNCATASNGDDEFCYCNTCSENEGNCDSHNECQDGLICGSNNCPASLGFDSEVDCCFTGRKFVYLVLSYPWTINMSFQLILSSILPAFQAGV